MATIDFSRIDYLRNGNPRQRKAYAALRSIQVMERLGPFSPLLAGTIPLGIDIQGSDLDILCFTNDTEQFCQVLQQHYAGFEGFSINHFSTPQGSAVTVSFRAEGFPVEVFGQAVPTRYQLAYRHMLIEYRLLQERGPAFRRQVVDLKRAGMKTEPAFALLLGCTGNPYQDLLAFE